MCNTNVWQILKGLNELIALPTFNLFCFADFVRRQHRHRRFTSKTSRSAFYVDNNIEFWVDIDDIDVSRWDRPSQRWRRGRPSASLRGESNPEKKPTRIREFSCNAGFQVSNSKTIKVVLLTLIGDYCSWKFDCFLKGLFKGFCFVGSSYCFTCYLKS